MSSNPFYLSTDGILFIIKDTSKTHREMTIQEKDMYRCADFESQMFAGGDGGSKGGRRPAEAGIKIKYNTRNIFK